MNMALVADMALNLLHSLTHLLNISASNEDKNMHLGATVGIKIEK